MSGGPKYEYRWQDNDKYKKPTILSASDYTSELMQWIEQLINDEAVFPTKVGGYFLVETTAVCVEIRPLLHGCVFVLHLFVCLLFILHHQKVVKAL